MMVRDIAHTRAGDKGDTLNVAVICYRAEDYPLLRERLTVARVRKAFAGIAKGTVRRYELPGHAALNFVIEGALGGGVSRTLSTDPHGKSFSALVAGIDLGQPA
ncbi:MAG TPA: hypothetical protein VEY95_11275 [Azospirillaceae bacterium]|nr:hypothetical protein [Azospirillaceae bacterium]